MTEHQDFHVWLSSKAAFVLSWIAAAMGIGTFLGWVNILVGVLSSIWLTVQLWNYFTYIRPANVLKLKRWQDMATREMEKE